MSASRPRRDYTLRPRVGLAVAICMLVSCASTATPSLATLAGATWTLVSLGGQPLAQGTRPPTAVFEGIRLSGFGGCNRYTGQVEEKTPGTIAIGPLAVTKMACPSPAMEVEDRYFAALAQVTQYRVAGSRLVLSGPSGELVFERAAP